MKPVSENLNYKAAQIRKVWPSRFASVDAAKPYAGNPQKLANKVYANRMGNGPEASGDGWRFRGRGYPQATGEENYEKFSSIVGVDLVKNPDRAMEPRIAAIIMFEGMTRGLFTGKKFSDYLNGDVPNYRAARAIINGDVAANGQTIAGYAQDFETALRAAGYIGQAPAPKPIIRPVTVGASEPIPFKPSEPAKPVPSAEPSASGGGFAGRPFRNPHRFQEHQAMTTNAVHNIINVLIAVLAAMATMDWTIFFTPETATAIVGGLSALKLIINVVRDGFAGLVKEQPPVK